jgi:hypothetical protein
MKPTEMLQKFDAYLAQRQLKLEAVVIGGTALALLGVTSRQTRDCDVLHPELPPEIATAAREFAAELRARGEDLGAEWLNNGPISLTQVLPRGWELRLQPAFEGAAITLHALGRLDLLRSKLFALCDRGFDLPDCLALSPTAEELNTIIPWLSEQDLNPDWPKHVEGTLSDLGRRLGHGL